MTVAVLLFFSSLLSIGGAYLWKQYLLSRQETYRQELAVREQQFNLSVISHLKVQSTKIALARQIIRDHVPASQIFSILSALTAEKVRFTAMDLETPDGTNSLYDLVLTGEGKDFSTVAFQSDVLNRLEQYGLNTVIKNPIVSNPELNQDGTVTFALTASVDLKSKLEPGTAAVQDAVVQPAAVQQPISVPQAVDVQQPEPVYEEPLPPPNPPTPGEI